MEHNGRTVPPHIEAMVRARLGEIPEPEEPGKYYAHGFMGMMFASKRRVSPHTLAMRQHAAQLMRERDEDLADEIASDLIARAEGAPQAAAPTPPPPRPMHMGELAHASDQPSHEGTFAMQNLSSPDQLTPEERKIARLTGMDERDFLAAKKWQGEASIAPHGYAPELQSRPLAASATPFAPQAQLSAPPVGQLSAEERAVAKQTGMSEKEFLAAKKWGAETNWTFSDSYMRELNARVPRR